MADAYVGGEPLVEVARSGFVESRHSGSVVVLGPDGEVVAWAGDVVGAIFPRSSNKPLQAVALLRAGLTLAPAPLALVCASHRGEPAHVSLVREMLSCAGLDESALGCPPDYPLSETARDAIVRAGGERSRVLMNCSGKHAGMLLTCLVAGWPVDGYLDPRHPLQHHIAESFTELTGEPIAAVGVDGCGAPVLSTSLRGLASGFARLVGGSAGTRERAVADAMRAFPEMVSGTDAEALDTRLMRGVPGLIVKGGAEGVIAAAMPGVGAVAVKIDDGSARAAQPVLVSALRRLGVVAAILDELAERPVLGGSAEVGAVRASW